MVVGHLALDEGQDLASSLVYAEQPGRAPEVDGLQVAQEVVDEGGTRPCGAADGVADADDAGGLAAPANGISPLAAMAPMVTRRRDPVWEFGVRYSDIMNWLRTL